MMRKSVVALLAALSFSLGGAGESQAFQIGSFARQLGVVVTTSRAPMTMQMERLESGGACKLAPTIFNGTPAVSILI